MNMLASRNPFVIWMGLWVGACGGDTAPAAEMTAPADGARPAVLAMPDRVSKVDAQAEGERSLEPEEEEELEPEPQREPQSEATHESEPPLDAEPQPPTNVSFETATPIEPQGSSHLQDVRVAKQTDYYVFEGKAGDYYEISTDRGRFQPDNFVVLYDSERNEIQRNDNGGRWSGDGIDARLVVKLPRAGNYYVTVQDPLVPERFFDGPFPLLYYHLDIKRLEPASGLAIVRDEELVIGSLAVDEPSGLAYLTVLFDLGPEARTLALSGRADHALIGHVLASASGSTDGGARLEVLNEDKVAVAMIEGSQRNFGPPVSAAEYQLSAEAIPSPDDGALVVVDLVLVPDNPNEQDDLGNDELAGAEPLMLEGTVRRRGLVLLRLPPGDVDHLSFDAEIGEYVGAICEGESGGSGVRELTAELVDEAGVVLASGQEAPPDNLSIDPVQMLDSRTVYLRVSSAAADQNVEPWVRCGAFVGP